MEMERTCNMIRLSEYLPVIAMRKNLFIFFVIFVLFSSMAVVDAFSSTNLYDVVINVKI